MRIRLLPVLLSALTVLCLSAGCGAPHGAADDPPSPAPAPTSTGTESVVAAPEPSDAVRSTPSTCEGERFLVTARPIEAGLGHRYWAVRVKNCTGEPVTFDELPGLSTTDAAGTRLSTRFVAHRDTDVTVTVDPHRVVWLGLEWVPRGVGEQQAARLVVRPGGGSAHSLEMDQLDLDESTRVTVRAWATRPSEVFSH